jgi:hypothetical protein
MATATTSHEGGHVLQRPVPGREWSAPMHFSWVAVMGPPYHPEWQLAGPDPSSRVGIDRSAAHPVSVGVLDAAHMEEGRIWLGAG